MPSAAPRDPRAGVERVARLAGGTARRRRCEWADRVGVDCRADCAIHGAPRSILEEAGATVLTPPGRTSGLLVFTLAGVDVEAAAATLEARGIVLRWVPQPRALRVSIGFFNDEQDMARLAAGLDDLTG